ncbi:MAG: 3-phosphoshikimate 1-carboxyvinyltransferase [Pseudomonadota bacterium]
MSEAVLVSSPAGVPICGEIRLPGDKSVSHRALMFSALADGRSQLSGVLEGEDCQATRRALAAMGVPIERNGDGLYTVSGRGLNGLRKPAEPLDMGNAGTGMRLFCGLLAGQSFSTTLIGDESLSRRPMDRVADPLNAMGAALSTTNGHAPICIEPAPNGLQGVDYVLPVASAQLKSALLIAGLYADGAVRVTEPGISRDHTERMLSAMGVEITRDDVTVTLRHSKALEPIDIEVPSDLSSAAFFLVAASIVPGSELNLRQVGVNPSRDGVLTILDRMGAQIERLNPRMCGGEPVADLLVRATTLKGIDVPPDLVPLAIDEFPVLFIAAAAARGKSRFVGLEELRHKESDRIAAMVAGLRTIGVAVEEGPDWVEIEGGEWRGGHVDSHHDHRIAMAFAVAGATASQPISIARPENIVTSFPNFSDLGNRVGMALEFVAR